MNDNSTTAATAASLIGGMLIGYGIVVIAIMVFTIWVYWRIFVKAGYNGALSLLNLVPGVGPLICMVILAFGRWPIEDELAALRAAAPTPGAMPPGAMPPGAMPPGAMPPGTSVMPAS